VTTEHFYIFKISIEVKGDEYAGSKLEVPCPFFGTWGFSACGDIHYSSKPDAATSFQVHIGYLDLESLHFYVFTFLIMVSRPNCHHLK
jgi:hypothetical protein